MRGRRLGGLTVVACAIVALTLPAGANAAKPTAKLEFEVPAEGKVGFSHLVFKTKKKPKALSRKAAKRAKKGSKKLSKKVRAKAKLKGGGGLSGDVQVAASVARLKGQKRTYAIDVAVAHSRPAPPRLGSSGDTTAGAAGAGLTGSYFIELLRDRGKDEEIARWVAGPTVDETKAPNVTDDPPAPSAVCGPNGDFDSYGGDAEFILNGDFLSNLEHVADFIAFAEFMFCGEPIPDDLDELFNVLGLDRPAGAFTCTGVRIGNNTPFSHTFTGGTCNDAIVDIRFAITKPAGGTYFDFNTPFPSCAFANGQREVHCTSPASSNKMRIQGSAFGTSQPTDCVRVVATNPLGQRYAAIHDTSAFATCP
jgi:hypothetical protein